jgi:hypothetical protein
MDVKGTRAVIGSILLLAVWSAFSAGIDWTPLAVGAGIGVLSWATFYFSGQAIGASSTYAKVAGFLAGQVAPNKTRELKYFKENPPRFDWGTVFFLGTILGALLAAISAGDYQSQWLSPLWVERFGENSLGLRLLTAFFGGAVMAFGARIAGGCTSGHGISGTMQLVPGSWLVFFSLFLGGSATAYLLYGGFPL